MSTRTLTIPDISDLPEDGAAGVASLRTLGTGAQQASAGNHTHTAASVGADAAGTAAALVDDLSGVSDPTTARSNLGLGTLATKSAIASGDITDGTIASGDLSAEARSRSLQIVVTDPGGDTLTTGDGKAFCVVPSELNNFVITALHAAVTTVSSSGAVTVQVARVRGGTPVDVLSTAITVDASETSSYTAATAPVINTSNDDVLTGDFLRVDIDGAGTGAKGLIVMATLQPV